MRYILSEPSEGPSKLLQMTRPIEKVERTSKLQTSVLIFDLANIILFIVAGVYQQELQF